MGLTYTNVGVLSETLSSINRTIVIFAFLMLFVFVSALIILYIIEKFVDKEDNSEESDGAYSDDRSLSSSSRELLFGSDKLVSPVVRKPVLSSGKGYDSSSNKRLDAERIMRTKIIGKR